MWNWRSLLNRLLKLQKPRCLDIVWTAEDRHAIWDQALAVKPREGAVVALCSRSTGRHRDTLIIRQPIEPQPGFLSYDRGAVVTVTSRYWNAAIDLISDNPEGTGVAVLHTHPGPGDPSWSADDNKADDELARFFFGERILAQNAPLLSLVGSLGHIKGRELIYNAGRVITRPVERVRTIAPDRFELTITTEAQTVGQPSAYADRSIRVFGKEGQQLLANLHVAVVGNGGVGSLVAEHLARMGIGTMSLWDPDIVKGLNINRSGVYLFAHIKKNKAQILGNILPTFALVRDIQVYSSDQDVRESTELSALLDADLIVMLVDDPRARHYINQLAYAHYIPVFDGGNAIKSSAENDGQAEHSTIEAGGVRINQLVPGGPCLWCAGHLTPTKLSLAFRTPEDIAADRARGYIENLGPEHAPSVMPVNSLTAALLEIRLQDFLYHLTKRAIPEVHYSLLDNTLDELPRMRKDRCRYCAQLEGQGDGMAV